MDFLPLTWADAASASQIIQLVVVVFGLVYAKRQIDEGAAARRLAATQQVLSEIGSDELRAIRSKLYAKFSGPITAAQAAQLGENEREEIRRLAVAYDRIAFLVHLKLVREDDLFEFQGEEIKRLWSTIASVIVGYREQTGRPGHCRHLEALAKKWTAKRK